MLVDARLPFDLRGARIEAALEEIRARRAVTIAVSQGPGSYRAAQALHASEPLVLLALGLHPRGAAVREARLDEALALAEEAPQIGEIGLDVRAVENRDTAAAQTVALDALLAVAARRDVPVHVSAPGSEEELAGALERHGVQRAVVHAYTGPVSVFRRLQALGCWFTVDVEVLTSDTVRRVAQEIQADRLLTASGPLGSPGQLPDVVRELALVRRLRARDVRSLVSRNLNALFGGKAELESAVRAARRA